MVQTRRTALLAAIKRRFGTQAAFARHIKVSKPYITNVINGKTVSAAQRARFARVLKTTIAEIFPAS